MTRKTWVRFLAINGCVIAAAANSYALSSDDALMTEVYCHNIPEAGQEDQSLTVEIRSNPLAWEARAVVTEFDGVGKREIERLQVSNGVEKMDAQGSYREYSAPGKFALHISKGKVNTKGEYPGVFYLRVGRSVFSEQLACTFTKPGRPLQSSVVDF